LGITIIKFKNGDKNVTSLVLIFTLTLIYFDSTHVLFLKAMTVIAVTRGAVVSFIYICFLDL